jgi:hypothetical protein
MSSVVNKLEVDARTGMDATDALYERKKIERSNKKIERENSKLPNGSKKTKKVCVCLRPWISAPITDRDAPWCTHSQNPWGEGE